LVIKIFCESARAGYYSLHRYGAGYGYRADSTLQGIARVQALSRPATVAVFYTRTTAGTALVANSEKSVWTGRDNRGFSERRSAACAMPGLINEQGVVMTLPAYKPNPSPRSAEHDNGFIFNLEMKHGRPECAIECNEYSVRRAATVLEYKKAANLVMQMYSSKGYLTDSIAALPRHDDTITVDAHDARQIMATLTVRFDSLGAGLLADTLYAKEIDEFRATGRKICEMTKLAVDPRHGSKELLAALIQVAYLYAHVVRGASDLLIEVNPRHVGFYKRMLGFNEIGDRRMCPRVNAPAVLLHVELDYMRQQIARHAGRGRRSSEKTLYSYFLNCSAEDWIDRAVRAKTEKTH